MYYCKRCCLLSQTDKCNECHKKIREVKDDDYCLITMIDALYSAMLEEIFDQYHVSYYIEPIIGAGITSSIGIRTEKYNVYVLYKDYEKANIIIQERFQK